MLIGSFTSKKLVRPPTKRGQNILSQKSEIQSGMKRKYLGNVFICHICISGIKAVSNSSDLIFLFSLAGGDEVVAKNSRLVSLPVLWCVYVGLLFYLVLPGHQVQYLPGSRLHDYSLLIFLHVWSVKSTLLLESAVVMFLHLHSAAVMLDILDTILPKYTHCTEHSSMPLFYPVTLELQYFFSFIQIYDLTV